MLGFVGRVLDAVSRRSEALPARDPDAALHDPAPAQFPTPTPRRHELRLFAEILACPQCKTGPLKLEVDYLLCPACERSYELVEGVPVLLPDPAPVRVMPLDHRSNEVGPHHIKWLSSFPGFTLNIGAGATQFKLPKCIELEYSIFRTTDLVGDALQLPFADDVFDAVITLNTFEHLSDPELAAREILRVLRPGGHLMLQTAFLQPLHEEPHHFYNTTEYGVRRWFREFEIDRCFVPGNMNPAYVLAWQSAELLRHVEHELGSDARRVVGAMSMEDLHRCWIDPTTRAGVAWAAMSRLSQETQRRLSGGFELHARKSAETDR